MKSVSYWVGAAMVGWWLSGAAALSQAADVDLRALVDLRYDRREFDVTALEPRTKFLGQARRKTTATAVISGEAFFDDVTVQGQWRASEASDDNGAEMATDVDEMFLEAQLAENMFAFAGRRNLAFGQAYGVSPADVFLDERGGDRSLSDARRRRERNGQDMLGLEMFWSDRLTLMAFGAPTTGHLNTRDPDRFLISANVLFPGQDADLTVLTFKDERAGVAWSASKAAGNSLVLYSDGSVRKGRDRQTVEPVGVAAQGTFRTVARERDGLIPSVTVGGGYTFESGVGINFEYFRNGNGYSSREWHKFEDLIRTNAANFQLPMHRELSAGNLLTLNGVLNSVYLRRNYLFGRITTSDVTRTGLNAEFTLLQSLDDGSGVVSSRFEHDVLDRLTVGLYASYQFGDQHSEFGLRAASARGTAYATVRF